MFYWHSSWELYLCIAKWHCDIFNEKKCCADFRDALMIRSPVLSRHSHNYLQQIMLIEDDFRQGTIRHMHFTRKHMNVGIFAYNVDNSCNYKHVNHAALILSYCSTNCLTNLQTLVNKHNTNNLYNIQISSQQLPSPTCKNTEFNW